MLRHRWRELNVYNLWWCLTLRPCSRSTSAVVGELQGLWGSPRSSSSSLVQSSRTLRRLNASSSSAWNRDRQRRLDKRRTSKRTSLYWQCFGSSKIVIITAWHRVTCLRRQRIWLVYCRRAVRSSARSSTILTPYFSVSPVKFRHSTSNQATTYSFRILSRPPLWSSGQSLWLQIQMSRVRFPALPDFLRSRGSGTGPTQPREDNWGDTWMKK
jgi:hypothetical protein